MSTFIKRHLQQTRSSHFSLLWLTRSEIWVLLIWNVWFPPPPVNNYCIITLLCLAFRLTIINRCTQTVFMQIYYVRIREWVRRVVKLNRRAIYFSNSFLKNNALPNVRIAVLRTSSSRWCWKWNVTPYESKR